MPVIQVSANQNKIKIDLLRLEKAAKVILSVLDCTEAELSVVIVDDEEMTSLNRQYRGIDSTTDVLAFSMSEGEFGDIIPELLGDVVISAPTADSISHNQDLSITLVLDLLLTHGILHLIGYDHEQGEEKARAMELKTIEIMEILGYHQKDLDWFSGQKA